MKNESSVINYFIEDICTAYNNADSVYRSTPMYFVKIAEAVYFSFEEKCKSHPKFNSKEVAIALRLLIIDYFMRNQYPMNSAMRTFVTQLPEKFKVRGEYQPLTLN